MKQIISTLIICSILLPSLIVISESTQKDYINDQLRFICTGSNGFNEAKYQQSFKMYEQQKRKTQSYDEVELTITQEFNFIEPISSADGPIDSPWPMKCHDNKHTGRSPYNTIDNNGAELWKFKTDTWIEDGSIIGSEGTIYFGDYSGNFYALNTDGGLKWMLNRGVDIGGAISSSPAISDDGTIYIGSWDDYFYAINPEGIIKWKVDSGGSISSSPVIGDDGTIYIGSGDTFFYAIKSDGTLKWRFKTGDYIKAPPSIANDGTIYIGSFDGYLYALNPDDGSMVWKSKIGHGTETNPSIGPDGTIYVGGDYLWAINPVDGAIKWSFNLGDNQWIFKSSPAVSAEGTIYVGTHVGEVSGGYLIAVNPDGTEKWRHRTAGEWVDSSPCIGENGIVYIGSSFDDKGNDYGYFYAFGYGENVNNPPNTPIITGPNNGKYGETYTYSITTADPDGDVLSYYIDWGDGSNSGWIGPYSSGTEITESHSWSSDGAYTIKVKAKDTDGSESNWATLDVTMPKNKAYYFSISKWLQAHFPLLENLFF